MVVWVLLAIGISAGLSGVADRRMVVTGRRISNAMRAPETQPGDVAFVAGQGLGSAALQLASAICRHYWPVALVAGSSVAALSPGGAGRCHPRRRRRLAESARQRRRRCQADRAACHIWCSNASTTWPTVRACGPAWCANATSARSNRRSEPDGSDRIVHFTHSDVLIVGAGSAGSVLAERLSVDTACTVTVVEAGPGPSDPGVRAMTDNGLQLPVGAASPLVARFETMLTDDPPRGAHIVRGATVGGSGAVNGGYFCRGIPRDFDDWQLPGWTWSGRPAALSGDRDRPGLHRVGSMATAARSGSAGWVKSAVVQQLFLHAAQKAGFAVLADLNAAPAIDRCPPGSVRYR